MSAVTTAVFRSATATKQDERSTSRRENLSEWTLDAYRPYASKDARPVAAEKGERHAVRGGSYGYRLGSGRSAGRAPSQPDNRQATLGARLACDLPKALR
ncbi:MAG: SUMF1/EgtB/PvdO family nonheme iron enzyme [Planctomycetota bacterium]